MANLEQSVVYGLSMSRVTRVYGGQTAEERHSERRRQLIEAALAIWTEEGWPAVTMRRVCSTARLTDRYFYESFADRDALLAAAWDCLRQDTLATIMTATFAEPDRTAGERLEVAIGAFVHSFEANPKRMRILFAEHSGSDTLERLMRETVVQFTDLFVQLSRPHLKEGADERGFRMTTLMGIGGFLTLLRARLDGVIEVSAAEFIHQAATAGVDLAARYLRADTLQRRVERPLPAPASATARRARPTGSK